MLQKPKITFIIADLFQNIKKKRNNKGFTMKKHVDYTVDLNGLLKNPSEFIDYATIFV